MSSYLGHRRRLSEQETSQSRYRWRSRGNSLSEQEPSQSRFRNSLSEQEPPQPRYNWRSRVYGTALGDDTKTSAVSAESRKLRKDDAGASHTSGDNCNVSSDRPRSEAERRREKYKRTHSEGHLKMRVRFSRDLEVSEECGEQWNTEQDAVEKNREERRTAFIARGASSTLSLSPPPPPSNPECGAEGGWGRRPRSDTWRSSGSQESCSFLWSSVASSSSVGFSDSFNDSFNFEDEECALNTPQPKDNADSQYNASDDINQSGCSNIETTNFCEGRAETVSGAMNMTPKDTTLPLVKEDRDTTSAREDSSDVSHEEAEVNEPGHLDNADMFEMDAPNDACCRSLDDTLVGPGQPQGADLISEMSCTDLNGDQLSDAATGGPSEPELSHCVFDKYLKESRNQALDAAMLDGGDISNEENFREQSVVELRIREDDILKNDKVDDETVSDNINFSLAESVIVGQDDIYRSNPGALGAPGAAVTQRIDQSDENKIERIMEQMMLEERSQGNIRDGGQYDMGLLKASVDLMSQDDIEGLRQEARDLQEVVSECNEEVIHDGGMVEEVRPLPTFPRRSRFSSQCYEEQQIMPRTSDTLDEDDEEDDAWRDLPVILLEDVFTLLTPKERHQASMVCREWYDLFYSPRVWETFILLERTLTKKRFNLYKGYQRELCPGKTQLCFKRVGSYFKRIVVTPVTDYNNLYEFLRILASYLQFQEDHGVVAMPLLHTFDFTFACATRNYEGVMLHGTGGQILEMIKALLCRMNDLKHLKLNQLLLDVFESTGLFDSIGACFGESLLSLEVLNVTKVPLAFPELAMFRNLLKLTVSPQHLNEEVLVLLSGLNLIHLHLVQDSYTCDCQPVSYEAWKLLKEMAPWLKVYLEISGRTKSQLLVQPRAPVHGIFLRTPYSRITNDLVMSVVEYYSKTLNYFVQERLPRHHGPRGFESRCDSNLLFLVRRCPRLHSLVLSERLSTSTLVLIASENPHLRTLLVRQNALIKRCDWPKHGEWPRDFYQRLRHAALDYDRCTGEICRLLRRRWLPLTDKEFLRIKLCPKLELF